MEGIEKAYLNAAIHAVLEANYALGELSCGTALGFTDYGKPDTRWLDEAPEIAIETVLTKFDKEIVIITEESRKIPDAIDKNKVVCFVDPMDGSSVLTDYLTNHVKDNHPERKVGELFADQKFLTLWEQEYGTPELSASHCSITAFRKENILFNVILNYLTKKIFVACPLGTFWQKITNFTSLLHTEDWGNIRVEKIQRNPVTFPTPDPHDYKRYVTYVGDEKYEKNLRNCQLGDIIREEQNEIDVPGPSRILYLSDLHIPPLGFILLNGEKCGEGLGWLAWVRFAKACNSDERVLDAYRISYEDSPTKQRISMAPGGQYSIFEIDRTSEKQRIKVNLDKLAFFDSPSLYRETILVVHKDNIMMRIQAEGQEFRKINLPDLEKEE